MLSIRLYVYAVNKVIRLCCQDDYTFMLSIRLYVYAVKMIIRLITTGCTSGGVSVRGTYSHAR